MRCQVGLISEWFCGLGHSHAGRELTVKCRVTDRVTVVYTCDPTGTVSFPHGV